MQRLEVSGAVRLLYGSLGVKGLNDFPYAVGWPHAHLPILCGCGSSGILDIALLCEWFPTFWRTVLPLSSRMSSHSTWTDCVISLKPPAQQNGIIPQNTRIFNGETLRTSDPAWYDVTLYFRKTLCCWWLRWLTLSVFYGDLLFTRESLDSRSQHDNITSKCGSGSYRQSAVCSRRIFRYGDEFGVVGAGRGGDVAVSGNDGMCCIMVNLFLFSLSFE